MRKSWVAMTFLLGLTSLAIGAMPDAPTNLADWPMPFAGDYPAIAADSLLDKPAAKDGPIVIRDGHFFTGDHRIRFWGVNFAFSANFPTHAGADAVAVRLAHLGINAVRLHHMDNQPFPNGIFADATLEKLSPESLDRLDYLIAALAKQGIYCDLNLHVSRGWAKSHDLPNADQLPDGDKMIDIFDPDIITANKQYARDLLSHVNAYTHHRYAEEPSICFVEINNEDSLFMWGGEAKLSNLPQPFAGKLNARWNEWLAKKYSTRDRLKAAWVVGEVPFGPEMLKWTIDAPAQPGDYTQIGKEWVVEQDGDARMTATGVGLPNNAQGIRLDITKVDATDWHIQFHQPGMKLEKGKFYTVHFLAQAARPERITVGVSMAHEPWENLGLGTPLKLTEKLQRFTFGFTASASDDNARLAFVLGQAVNTITLSNLSVCEGGRLGLRDDETAFPSEPTNILMINVSSHNLGAPETSVRTADWFDFLQYTDQKYYVDMYDFLKKEIGVTQQITGTIGFGGLGTQSQSHMDFVDAHQYWDHPSFPHRQWDMNDWLMKNTAMVDEPNRATLWDLAGTRVAGKPFTVTEYAHPSPNDWSADGVPMIASFAALQDWDAVFLFAYSHDSHYDKDHAAGYFDIEANPTKTPFLPMAARIFLGHDIAGAIAPMSSARPTVLHRQPMLDTASIYYHQMWPFLHEVEKVERTTFLQHQFSVRFSNEEEPDEDFKNIIYPPDSRANWIANGPGTGRYTVADPHGVVFVGFKPDAALYLNVLRIEKLDTPYVSMMLVPADPAQTIATADRLLLTVVARAENTGMVHNADRTSIGRAWGHAPPRIEVVKGEISLPDGKYKAYAITSEGQRGEAIETQSINSRVMIPIGGTPTVWYEIDREK